MLGAPRHHGAPARAVGAVVCQRRFGIRRASARKQLQEGLLLQRLTRRNCSVQWMPGTSILGRHGRAPAGEAPTNVTTSLDLDKTSRLVQDGSASLASRMLGHPSLVLAQIHKQETVTMHRLGSADGTTAPKSSKNLSLHLRHEARIGAPTNA